MLDVALVGTGGTVPLPGRWLSALLVRLGPDLVLFDCGEGTQISMRRLGWGFKAVGAICLSHLHADHVAGLPGLLLTIGNAGRREPLWILGPPATATVVAGLRSVAPHLPYRVAIRELVPSDDLPLGPGRLACLPLDHAVPCLGYRLDVPRARRFDPDRARAIGVPLELWKRLQRGEGVAWDGRRAAPEDVLGPARRGLRVAYVTDTRPTPRLPDFVRGADLLVCEGTYGDPADAENAVENKHLLFSEAAELARAAEVRRLWLTHFSAKLTDPAEYRHHAAAIFPNTVVGRDHLAASLRFEDEAAVRDE
jgi:ribonuclease Z